MNPIFARNLVAIIIAALSGVVGLAMFSTRTASVPVHSPPPAVAVQDRAQTKSPQCESDENCGLGWQGIENKDYDLAIAYFNEALRLDSQNTEALRGRGVANSSKGNQRSAIADFSEYLKKEPSRWEGYALRGFAFYCLGDYQSAIPDFSDCMRLHTESDGRDLHQFLRGEAYLKTHAYDQAISDLTEVIRKKPTPTAGMYLLRGKAFLFKKGFYQAITDFSHAISLDSRNDEAFYFRCVAKSQLREYLAAMNDSTQAININPNNSAYFKCRADLNRILNNPNQADLDERESGRLKSLGK